MEADPKPAVSTSVKRGRPKKLNPTGPVDYPEVCRICQEPATRHLHYGSIVCFSCKAFFRRAIQNEVHTLFTCAVENRCEMNSVSRKHCQKCRWDACLRVGMKSQWVLSKKERVKRMERRQSQGMESLPRQVGEACEATWSRDSEDQPRETSRDALESHGSTSSVQSSSPELGIPKQVSFDPTEDQFIENITKIYDQQFRSVSLGEVIIKEMIVSSLYNVPISVSSSLSAYRLMVNRVTKIANSFDTFCTFPMRIKMALLKKNADPMVLLNGATFFSESAKEQIQVSMGEDDALSSGILIDRSKEAIDKAGSISYWNWNTIQTYHSPDVEDVFSNQLKRLGTLLERNPVLLKVFSFVVLLSTEDLDLDRSILDQIENVQLSVLQVLERFLHRNHGPILAVSLFGNLITAVSDLRQMSRVNAIRQFTSAATTTPEIKSLSSCMLK